MKKLSIVLTFIFIFGINFSSYAQLSGLKSIPGDYSTIAQAVDSLNLLGVGGGGVVFNVAANHTETSSNVVINITTNNPTASNQVVFQKSGVGANPLITAAAGTSPSFDGIIKLFGVDYVTFDAIDLLDPASNTGDEMMEWGYAILRKDTADGSQNNTIKNCTVTLQKINTASIGIYIVNRTADGIVRNTLIPSGLNSFNRIFGNTVTNVYKGIVASSTSLVGQKDIDNEVGINGQTANTITNWGGSTVSAEGIRVEGQVNIKVNNNIINGGTGTSGGATTVGIILTGNGSVPNAANYEISYNQVTISGSSSSQVHHGIRALGNGDTVRIHHNIVENCTSGQATNGFSALTHDPVGATNASYVYNNIVRNNTLSGTGTFTLINCAASGDIAYLQIRSNEIYGNQKTGISGTMNCISAADATIDCYSNLVYNNSTPNSSGASTTSVFGYVNNGNPIRESVFENEFYNLSVGGLGTSASSLVIGIRSNANATAVKEFHDNKIYALSGVSGSGTTGGVYGIYSSLSGSADIYRNKIFNVTNNGSIGVAGGIWVSSGLGIQIHDNLINDIKAPNSTGANAVIGISSTSTTANSTIDIFDNSIYLTASGGATFGSSGISVAGSATATSAAVTMQNNNIINLSTPGTTSGNTVAYRRSNVNLANYGAGSDFNNFYSGNPITPGRLIFFDGINSDATLAAYQLRVAPRDANSTSVQLKSLNLTINFEACNEIDTISVVIRQVTSPYNVVDSVVGLGGAGIKQVFNLNNLVDGVPYYIVVRHRNSIETWSKSGGEMFTGVTNYDYTSAATQAFGNNMVNVGGKWSFYTGDVNQDGIVDGADALLIDNATAVFQSGYVVTDLNCDEIVDGSDAAFEDNNAFNFINVIRP